MSWTRILLIAAALEILGVGLVYLIAPGFMVAQNGITLASVDHVHLVRAAYGGLFVTFGASFLLGALMPALERFALYGLLLFMGGFAFGRLTSILVDGLPGPTFLIALASELLFAGGAALLLRRAPSTPSCRR